MIKLRYHHIMCIPRFEGKGYSKKFCENMAELKPYFEKGEYELTDKCDDVCKACPNLVLGRCITHSKVARYDKAVKACLENGIEPKPQDICSDCKWYEICKDKQYFIDFITVLNYNI